MPVPVATRPLESSEGRPLRVVQVIRSAGSGGVETHVRLLAQQLIANGIDCRIVSLTRGEIGRDFADSRLNIKSLDDRMGWTWRTVATIWDLRKLLQSIDPDLVHLHGARPTFVGGVARRLGGRYSCVASLHGAHDLMAVRDDGSLSMIRSWLARIVHRVGFLASDRVIVCARALLVDVRSCIEGWGRNTEEFIRRKTRVVYHGVEGEAATNEAAADAVAKRPKERGPTMVVGCLSRLDEPKKGIGVLLKAAAELEARGLPIDLRIAGEGHSRSQLDMQRKCLGIRGCTFLGFVPSASDFLYDLDVFVLPSFSEGTPLVLMEAMLAGVPVVATRVGGIPEIVEDGVTGVTVPAGDPGALADALAVLVQDSSARQSLAAAGRAKALQSFTVPAMYSQVLAVYEEALGARKEPQT